MSNEEKIDSRSYESYLKSPYLSIKQSTYFNVYDKLFSKFIDKEIIFIEVGVLEGGSLFMWRDYFGKNARIIGVDLNPEAKKWEKDGFEIFIGDQSSEKFWKETLDKIGKIDVVLDDGGHTFEQQIMTTESTIPYIKEGGIIVVEDCCTSYMKNFGIRTLSFVNYAKKMVDNINKRYVEFDKKKSEKRVWSIQFFESIIAFHFNSFAMKVESKRTSNHKEEIFVSDFRYNSYPLIIDKLEKLSKKRNLKSFKIIIRLLRKLLFNLYHVRRYFLLKKYLKSKNII